jgi:hypothetical protein
MARFGGLFHLCRSISNLFKKKRCFDKALREFRVRSPSVAKSSTAQNWHKAAQNLRVRPLSFARKTGSMVDAAGPGNGVAKY